MTVIYAILIFGLLIFVHELGHFIVAKLSGIAVLQFNIGFGPAIFKKRYKETIYALRILPLGGSVMLKSENGEDDEEELRQYAEFLEEGGSEKGNFSEASLFQRFGVCVAGSLMNFLCGVLIIFFVLVPAASVITPQLSGFMEGFAYEGEDGFMEGDKILRINEFHIYVYGDVVTALSLGNGEPFDFTVLRNGEKVQLKDLPLEATLYTPEDPKNPKYGFLFTAEELTFGSKIGYSAGSAMSFLQSAVKSIGMLISGDAGTDDLVGTVGIASEISNRAKQSAQDLWYFVAYISVNLAFVNLLPIPALDGGKLLFMLIELVRGKPVDPKYEGYVSVAGMVLLLGLFVVVTYNDIIRLVAG